MLYDGEKFYVSNKDILIEDKIISKIKDEISIDLDIVDKVIDGNNKFVIPGMINSHTHSYMSLFRNHADDLGFNDWLFNNILPLEDKLARKDAYWGSMLSIMEMINTGTTSFVDMYMFINQTCKAVEESGIRAFLSRGLVGNDNDIDGIKRLEEAKNEIKDWKSRCSRIEFMFAPHAPYTCSPKYLQKVLEEAKTFELPINIHLSESRNEYRNIKEKYGMSPTEYIERQGIFGLNTLAAHCVYMSDNDIEILSKNNVTVVTNPISNMKLANGFAPINRLLNKNINVTVGTDGAASNNNLNIFKELQSLTLIHKGVYEDPLMINANQALRMATVNAAKFFRKEDEIGLINEGMKADLAIIDIDRPNFYPKSNLVSAMVYSMLGNEVITTIIDGKVIMENKEFLTIDEEKIKYNVNKIYNRICN